MKFLFDENLSPQLPRLLSDISLMFGMPPKVIRVRLGNCSTAEVANLLRTDFNVIKMFAEDGEVSLLVLP